MDGLKSLRVCIRLIVGGIKTYCSLRKIFKILHGGCILSFSTGAVIIIFACYALAFIIPILFIVPFLLRWDKEKMDNTGFISLIYLELPIGTTALAYLFYFNKYFDSFFEYIFNLIPYTLILWYVCFLRKSIYCSPRKILFTGWRAFAIIFVLHTFYLFPMKNESDYDTAVNTALRQGDGTALDKLWKTCPEGINSLLFNMKFNYNRTYNFDYPITSFEKVIQCSEFKDDFTSDYAVNYSFANVTSINFLKFLYSKIDDNKKKEIQNDKGIIDTRLIDLKRCLRDEKCSAQKIQMLDFLLKLVPKWQKHLFIKPVDLHNSILNSNKLSASYFSKFVQPENENDIIAMHVVLGDNQSVISKIKNKEYLPSVIGQEYGDFGENITLVKFIIMNGTEDMIDFIINDLNVDVACYASASTINYNTIVSSDYNYKYNKRFQNKTCTNPIKS
ncbi:hypothetical protein FEK48_15240 [Escherichia sp. E2593]|uniref:hypothetical protein n=1 Tax=unclassified Escherichia TaxID=2608889 RepID=UPI0010297A1A|nr:MULTISPECIES: hypothetical protein [unclassified Escherichia]TLI80777.1 hypothetical protein FEK48_15240 [Escherichia sp. E2593]